MATYAEFLAENGATADEVKLLDTPAARKGYDKLQAQVAEASTERQRAADIIKKNQEWATQVETQNQQYLRERDSASLESAAAAAKMKKLQELGLLEVAERIEPGSTTPKPGETPAFDASKYVDRDLLMQVADREGEAIATIGDMIQEHQSLFPGKPLNFRELRREALGRKMTVESLWSERFNVPAARDQRATADRAAHEKKIADDAVAKYKSEHSATNPLTAIPVLSRTPFSGKVISAGEGTNRTQPWQKSDAEKENPRLTKVLASLEKQGIVQ